jgi:hypothetical protein
MVDWIPATDTSAQWPGPPAAVHVASELDRDEAKLYNQPHDDLLGLSIVARYQQSPRRLATFGSAANFTIVIELKAFTIRAPGPSSPTLALPRPSQSQPTCRDACLQARFGDPTREHIADVRACRSSTVDSPSISVLTAPTSAASNVRQRTQQSTCWTDLPAPSELLWLNYLRRQAELSGSRTA